MSAPGGAVDRYCGRCGKYQSPTWKDTCQHCGALYAQFAPTERPMTVAQVRTGLPIWRDLGPAGKALGLGIIALVVIVGGYFTLVILTHL